MWRGVKTIMLLHQFFKWASDVEHFVKANYIQQGDIQTLLYNPDDKSYHLFYWS